MRKASLLIVAFTLSCVPHALWSQSDSTPSQTNCVPTQPGCTETSDPTVGQKPGTPATGSYSDMQMYQRSSPTEMAPLTNRSTKLPGQRQQTLPMDVTPLNGYSSVPQVQTPPVPLTEFQNFVMSTTGEKLPIYGANLFRKAPSTFSPSELNPVSADYVIGPDDELRVRIWGGTAYSGNLRVDRSGSIYIPQVGSIQVAGLKFSQLDQRLRSAVSQEYKNFDLSVELGRIRSIQVYLTGQVTTPGAYTVSSMSSLVDALFVSGGPSPQGSLRHVVLKRDGKIISDFDLYSLLLHGDKTGDVRLQAEDVLYVPPVGKQVAILGSVHTPAILELRENEHLGDLLAATGGTTSLASQTNILIDRVTDSGHREAIDVPFGTSTQALLRDGDIVRVQSAVPSYKNSVTLRGRVANAGRMPWHPGMRLSDLIPDRDSLLSREYWWKRSHLSLPSQEFPSDVVPPQPLAQKFQRSVNMPANEDASQNDVDAAHSASKASIAEEATLTSAIHNGTDDKVSVRLLDEDIDWSYAVIERRNPEDMKTSLLPFDLGKLVNGHDESQNLPLQPNDIVTIFSVRDLRQPIDLQTKYVTIEGEVAHAGAYSVGPGETLTDVIARAGGLTPKAYLFGAEFTRESARRFQQRRIDEYVQEIDLEVRRGALAVANAGLTSAASPANTVEQDRFLEQLRKLRASGRVVLGMEPNASTIQSIPSIELENGDRFIIPSRPATINVVGAVFNPNVFLFKRAAYVKDYLALAGGANRNADGSKMFIIRADGSVENRSEKKGIFGDSFMRAQLNPGDTLMVPDKRLRPNLGLKTFMDYTQVFSQLAVGAAAVSVLR